MLGGLELDFRACHDPSLHDITVVSLFGGANLKVRPEQPVRLDGFSLLGGRNVEPRRLPAPGFAEADELPMEVAAYAIFGGVNVDRKN